MQAWKPRFFRKRPAKHTEDVTRKAREVGKQVDRTAMEIFTTYRSELLARPITYVVPAVWGAMKESEPDETQKAMNRTIAPMVEEVLRVFGASGLDASQRFALGYLVRGYLISRITYMIEASRNQENPNDPNSGSSDHRDPFNNGTPVGHA